MLSLAPNSLITCQLRIHCDSKPTRFNPSTNVSSLCGHFHRIHTGSVRNERTKRYSSREQRVRRRWAGSSCLSPWDRCALYGTLAQHVLHFRWVLSFHGRIARIARAHYFFKPPINDGSMVAARSGKNRSDHLIIDGLASDAPFSLSRTCTHRCCQRSQQFIGLVVLF